MFYQHHASSVYIQQCRLSDVTPCHVWLGHQDCDLPLTSALCVVQILNDSEARFNSADLNIAYKMDVAEYQRLCPYSQSLEANWGKAPGMSILHGLNSCLDLTTCKSFKCGIVNSNVWINLHAPVTNSRCPTGLLSSASPGQCASYIHGDNIIFRTRQMCRETAMIPP